ncbi:OPT oligopeptide transporter [Trametes versicolor FP-101664 SS1]|uniref:OPT oligopeptide transporter n=1 Tax=Trametes versicolor (strain FP-101664) TaxID=717944 RepID=UPI00046244AE|nr:OPT oligopeptide transporter [Trametes versicolor FP-101664 SS1]EIW64935.1 OPT oligopeptide transporter [Trametes versicolor FP-101664 SS1]
MEAKTSSYALNLPTLLRRRNSSPDVPEDVDYIMSHLNDPNWDLSQPPTASTETFADKAQTSSWTDHSYHETETETASQLGSTRVGTSKFDLREAKVEEYNEESPYAEVRAAVPNTDDPSIPVNTFRVWFLGIILSVLLSGLNHFFLGRWPSVAISALIAQLVALPLGKGLEWLLPTRQFNTLGYVWSFNPGPFSVKEHAVITIMANAVYTDVYSTSIFAAQRVWYNERPAIGYELLITLSSQMIGYAWAGIARQLLVWPASMIWPSALVSCALLNTLNRNWGKVETKHISRERFFLYVAIGSTFYYFLPGFLFTGLSMFSWVCWIAPQNQTVNTLFGYNTGLGLGFLTFDWSMISWLGSPLVSPWWTEANVFIAFVIIYWIIAPIMYFKNVLFAKYFPISTSSAFDNMGMPYDITAVVDENGFFDVEKYKAYSPLFMPVNLQLAYGTQFAMITAVVVHTFLWYRHDIVRQFRRSLRDEKDVHSRLMMSYPEVPAWWYGSLFLVAFVFGVVAIEVYPTQFPVWAFILSLIIGFVFVIPVGIIRAITNQLPAINVLAELVGGYVLPGRPLGVMVFKTFGFVSMYQSLFFLNDLKIGHYMKIPPRVMFMAQVVASTLACFVCVGVQEWQFANIEGYCTPTQKDGFVCNDIETFATASIIWGGIGPQRLFSHGAMYNYVLYFFLIGALLPIPFYLLAVRYPTSFWRYVNIPVCFAGLAQLPPATGISYSSFTMVGAFFQWFVRRYHFRWWLRFNYILSAGLDIGVSMGMVLVFFCLQYPKGGVELNWWGNTVWQNTFDAMGMPALFTNTTIGPQVWA